MFSFRVPLKFLLRRLILPVHINDDTNSKDRTKHLQLLLLVITCKCNKYCVQTTGYRCVFRGVQCIVFAVYRVLVGFVLSFVCCCCLLVLGD
jgi:hypothetical protein